MQSPIYLKGYCHYSIWKGGGQPEKVHGFSSHLFKNRWIRNWEFWQFWGGFFSIANHPTVRRGEFMEHFLYIICVCNENYVYCICLFMNMCKCKNVYIYIYKIIQIYIYISTHKQFECSCLFMICPSIYHLSWGLFSGICKWITCFEPYWLDKLVDYIRTWKHRQFQKNNLDDFVTSHHHTEGTVVTRTKSRNWYQQSSPWNCGLVRLWVIIIWILLKFWQTP